MMLGDRMTELKAKFHWALNTHFLGIPSGGNEIFTIAWDVVGSYMFQVHIMYSFP